MQRHKIDLELFVFCTAALMWSNTMLSTVYLCMTSRPSVKANVFTKSRWTIVLWKFHYIPNNMHIFCKRKKTTTTTFTVMLTCYLQSKYNMTNVRISTGFRIREHPSGAPVRLPFYPCSLVVSSARTIVRKIRKTSRERHHLFYCQPTALIILLAGSTVLAS